MKTKIAIASDHGGFELKRDIVSALGDKFELIDRGPTSPDSVDYPDFAAKVAQDVAQGEARFGILICTSGIGMSISANKVRGIRAGLVCDARMAELARRHNDANIICLGAAFISTEEAIEAVEVFMATAFDGDAPEGLRHKRRVRKITELEE